MTCQMDRSMPRQQAAADDRRARFPRAITRDATILAPGDAGITVSYRISGFFSSLSSEAFAYDKVPHLQRKSRWMLLGTYQGAEARITPAARQLNGAIWMIDNDA